MNHTPPKPPSEPLEENIERLQRTGTPQRLKACEFRQGRLAAMAQIIWIAAADGSEPISTPLV